MKSIFHKDEPKEQAETLDEAFDNFETKLENAQKALRGFIEMDIKQGLDIVDSPSSPKEEVREKIKEDIRSYALKIWENRRKSSTILKDVLVDQICRIVDDNFEKLEDPSSPNW